jgi:hypothetical protein
MKIIIDLDTTPFEPDGLYAVHHQPGGQFDFDPERIMCFLDPQQREGSLIKGVDLLSKLKDHNCFNANMLDWYLANTQYIPEEFKGKMVYFWGTMYRQRDEEYVRCLLWDDNKWRSSQSSPWNSWGPNAPALILLESTK